MSSILSVPSLVRIPLAWFIAKRRAPVAREIYAKIGGRSPILAETEAQAQALQSALAAHETRAFVAMRCSKPFSDDTARAVAAWKPDRIVLLPLYPQFSTTTTASSIKDWRRAAAKANLTAPHSRICCYPRAPGFIAAMADLTRQTIDKERPNISYRVLLSAHGLPERIVAKGDPYRWQVEQTAKSLVELLGITDWSVCYQSRVGPLKWIGPSTDDEIRRAGAEGKGVVVVPIAFVSEHSETLVELDLEYRALAQKAGVLDYLRVPTVGVHPAFIADLARQVLQSLKTSVLGHRICPSVHNACGLAQE